MLLILLCEPRGKNHYGKDNEQEFNCLIYIFLLLLFFICKQLNPVTSLQLYHHDFRNQLLYLHSVLAQFQFDSFLITSLQDKPYPRLTVQFWDHRGPHQSLLVGKDIVAQYPLGSRNKVYIQWTYCFQCYKESFEMFFKYKELQVHLITWIGEGRINSLSNYLG